METLELIDRVDFHCEKQQKRVVKLRKDQLVRRMPLGELDLNRGEDRRRQRSRSFGSGNDSTSPTHVLTNGYDSDDIISPRKDENVDIYNRLDPAAKVNMGFKSRLFTPESVTKVLRNRVNRVKEIGHKNKEVVNTRNDGSILTFKADLEEAKPPIDVSKMKGNKWLKIGNSIVKETSQKPWRDLVRWGAVIFLWVLAICYPELPMQTMTQGVSFAQTHFRTWTPDNKVEVPQAAEFKRPKNLVEEQKIDYSAAPYLGMVLPVEDVVAVETGDLSIRFEIKNVYPNKIAAHRGSKVCLRIAGDQSHTTLGCLDIQPTLDIVLRDLAPGKITLVATLLSQARKLATVSKVIHVSNRGSGIASLPSIAETVPASAATTKYNSQSEDGSQCTTTCKRTCTTVFELP